MGPSMFGIQLDLFGLQPIWDAFYPILTNPLTILLSLVVLIIAVGYMYNEFSLAKARWERALSRMGELTTTYDSMLNVVLTPEGKRNLEAMAAAALAFAKKQGAAPIVPPATTETS